MLPAERPSKLGADQPTSSSSKYVVVPAAVVAGKPNREDRPIDTYPALFCCHTGTVGFRQLLHSNKIIDNNDVCWTCADTKLWV
jgi:hypothetical protein